MHEEVLHAGTKGVLARLKQSSDYEDWQTINGFIDDVKFSYFNYPYPLLFPTTEYEGVPLVSLQDLACMKLDTIGRRSLRLERKKVRNEMLKDEVRV